MTTSKKKRVRVWTSEDRAAHRVFEKSRREAFNDGMINLARQLPSLAGTRRLNKHLIVEHSVARHKAQKRLAHVAAHEFRELLAERDELIAEVNRWRLASGATLPSREARPVRQQLQALLEVERETFGAFPNGFGDNGGPDGSDEHGPDEISPEVADDVGCPINSVPDDRCNDQNLTSISPTTTHRNLSSISGPQPQSLTASTDANMFNYGDSFDLDLQNFDPPLPHGLLLTSDTSREGLDMEYHLHQFNGSNAITLHEPSTGHFHSIGPNNTADGLF